jgi:hypothetical protein
MVLPQTIHHLGGFARAPLPYSNQYRIGTEKRACGHRRSGSRIVGKLEVMAKVLVNAVTVQVKTIQNHISGNPTYRDL